MTFPFNDPFLAAAMNTAHQGLKSGQEIGAQTERERAKPLLEALTAMEAGYRERCNYCGGSIAICDACPEGGCRAPSARAGIAAYMQAGK